MRKWTNQDEKKAACIAVLTKIASDKKFGEKCLKSEEFARNAFRTIGEIDVPESAKVVFLPEGDVDNSKREGTGSLVLELPPSGKEKNLNDHVIEYVRCTYVTW